MVAIQNAAEQGAAKSLGTALVQLARVEPARWLRILRLESVLPDATARDWQDRLPAFLDALRYVLAADVLDSEALGATMRTLHALLDIGGRRKRIGDRLDDAAFFNRSPATQTYRLAMWLESQAALVDDAVANLLL